MPEVNINDIPFNETVGRAPQTRPANKPTFTYAYENTNTYSYGNRFTNTGQMSQVRVSQNYQNASTSSQLQHITSRSLIRHGALVTLVVVIVTALSVWFVQEGKFIYTIRNKTVSNITSLQDSLKKLVPSSKKVTLDGQKNKKLMTNSKYKTELKQKIKKKQKIFAKQRQNNSPYSGQSAIRR